MVTVLQVFIIIGMLWLPESPEYYFAKGRFDESKQVLMRIAAINGRSIDERQICFDHVATADEKSQDSDE